MFCWLYRLIISNAADTGSELSHATQRHIDNCANCREFRQICLSLGEGLKREAAQRGAGDELPADLVRRVLAAAPAKSAETFTLPIRWTRPALAAACIVVAALIAVFSLTWGPDEAPPAEPPRIDGLYGLIDDGHLRLRRTWTGLVDKPLTEEIENLTRGTESAVRFLVACVAVDPTNTANRLPN